MNNNNPTKTTVKATTNNSVRKYNDFISVENLELILPVMRNSKKRITSQDWVSSKSLNEISLPLPEVFCFKNSMSEADPQTSALQSFSESHGSLFDYDDIDTEKNSYDETKSQFLNEKSPPFLTMIDQPRANTEMICTPTNLDVLLGRGGLTNKHAGNIRYREEVEKVKPLYFSCRSKSEKKDVSELLVAYVQSYGGRFLVKDLTTNNWVLASHKAARRKASQALRETKWKSTKEKKEDKPG